MNGLERKLRRGERGDNGAASYPKETPPVPALFFVTPSTPRYDTSRRSPDFLPPKRYPRPPPAHIPRRRRRWRRRPRSRGGLVRARTRSIEKIFSAGTRFDVSIFVFIEYTIRVSLRQDETFICQVHFGPVVGNRYHVERRKLGRNQ